MEGDPKLLFQVVSNLLSNAVQYSPGGGLIKITAGTDAEQIVISVQDHGTGIPEADRERLFSRYYRGSNVCGIVETGVGLYLVRMVIELHGGEIAVESREGEGSRFTVRLPTHPPRGSEGGRPQGRRCAKGEMLNIKITIVTDIILDIFDFGMNMAEATEAVRIHHQWQPDGLQVERGLTEDTIRRLEALWAQDRGPWRLGLGAEHHAHEWPADGRIRHAAARQFGRRILRLPMR
ncbi:MAG: ATP-binding protein [Methylocella sp.]